MADTDGACSRYDRDESCSSGTQGSKDDACGTTSISWGWDPVDNDDNCRKGADPDDSSSTNTCIQGGG
jgi:hypothetical protein